MIKNNTKKNIIAHHSVLADTFYRRLKGLLGTTALPHGEGFIIKPCSSVHTFGMKYSIDVLFVDKNHKIIKKNENMRPGQVSMAFGSSYVIELPAGTIGQTECMIGDEIKL